MTAHDINLRDDHGYRVASFIEDTALDYCAKVTKSESIENWRVVDEYAMTLLRPFALLSTGEQLLWTAALWLADMGDAPSFSECREFLSPEDYERVVAEYTARIGGVA